MFHHQFSVIVRCAVSVSVNKLPKLPIHRYTLVQQKNRICLIKKQTTEVYVKRLTS